MKKLSIVAFVLVTTCFTVTRPAMAAPEAPVVKKSETATKTKGLWMEFQLGAWAGFSGMMVVGTARGFGLGYKFVRVVVAAEIGLSWSRFDSEGPSTSWEYQSFGVTVVPQVKVTVLEHGPVSLYVLGGCGVGFSRWKFPSSGDQLNVGWSVVADVGFGVRYHLHPRFALGVELALDGTYSHQDERYEGDHAESNGWSAGIHGAMTASVVF